MCDLHFDMKRFISQALSVFFEVDSLCATREKNLQSVQAGSRTEVRASSKERVIFTGDSLFFSVDQVVFCFFSPEEI